MLGISNSSRRIADKLFYGIIILLVLTLGAMGSFIAKQRTSSIKSRIDNETAATSNFLEKTLPPSAISLDASQMRKDIASTLSDQLQAVEIFDKGGERIYVYERETPKKRNGLAFDKKVERDLIYRGNKVGRFSAYFDIRHVLREFQVREFLRLIVMISAAGLMLGGGLYYLVRKIIIKPIEETLKFSKGLAGGDYGKRIDVRYKDEMGSLQESLNRMADALSESLENLKSSFYEAEGSRQEALAASRVKSEFLASMSHEIRTPINAIVGFADLLLETETSEEKKDNLKTIKKSAQILLDNINDILDFSKIEAGKLRISNSEFPVLDIIEEVTPIVKLRLHGKTVVFASELSPDLPPTINCDRTRLRQVLLNVLINAAKFTHTGKIVLKIMPEDDERLLFSVEDTGIGIPTDAQKNLFEPFTQADGSITREYGGTGLGLAIAKRLIEMMGGRIWIESKTGDGTIISFTISALTRA